MHRIRRLSVALTVAGVVGVAAPAAASATSLDHHQRRHVLLSARVSACGQVRQAAPEQGPLQDRPGRHDGRPQRRQSRQRHDRRRGSGTHQRRRRPGLLPDRQVRDLRRHQQGEHAQQPHAEPGDVDLHRQDKDVERRAGCHRNRSDRSLHPHVGRRRADELQVAAAGRQERRVQRHRRGDRGSDAPGGRKRTERDRLPVQLPGGQRRPELGLATTASPATRRPLRPASTPAWRCSSRSPKAPPPAPPPRSSTGSTSPPPRRRSSPASGSRSARAADRAAQKAKCSSGCESPGRTTAPSVCSARCRCSSASASWRWSCSSPPSRVADLRAQRAQLAARRRRLRNRDQPHDRGDAPTRRRPSFTCAPGR